MEKKREKIWPSLLGGVLRVVHVLWVLIRCGGETEHLTGSELRRAYKAELRRNGCCERTWRWTTAESDCINHFCFRSKGENPFYMMLKSDRDCRAEVFPNFNATHKIELYKLDKWRWNDTCESFRQFKSYVALRHWNFFAPHGTWSCVTIYFFQECLTINCLNSVFF